MGNQKISKRLKIAILLSVGLHMLLLVVKVADKVQKPNRTLIKFNLADKNQKKLLQKMKAKINSQKGQKIVIKKKKPDLGPQIVNNELSGREEKPQDTRFLGAKNQKFDRQTISKNIDKFNKGGKGIKNGSSLSKNTKSQRTAVVKKTSQAKKVVKQIKKTSDTKGINPKKVSLRDLAFSAPQPAIEKIAQAALNNRPESREIAALGSELGDENSKGLNSNNDFIEDIPLGDMTNLNTVEFKYFGFYHRVRQQLEQFWGNTLRKKATELYKKGRRLVGNENYITSLVISIDNVGKIVEIQLVNSSGYKELDEAAIDSFNRAGPFPNPPKGMLKGGLAKIKWGFVVKG